MTDALHFIDGEHRPALGGGWLDNIEPATGKTLGRVAAGDGRDIDAAVRAAQRAFPAWSALPVAERSRLLLRMADLIDERREELARAESRDCGKPIRLSLELEIPRGATNFRFFASASLHAESATHFTDGLPGGGRAINSTQRRPRGVAGLISPWNLPLYLLTWKIAPALATGNTAVCKPSELTPTTASMLGTIARDAGLPPGVLNVVHGTGAAAGAPLVAHADTPTISFTGGTATGRAIASVAGPMFKRVALELGGKNPNLVFADADMDRAVGESVRAAFTNQGQICRGGSRIFVERPAYAPFLGRFVERARALRIGDPEDEATEFGALISADHRKRVTAHVEGARRDGGRVECGGRAIEGPTARTHGGFYFEPTVVTGLAPSCALMQEEVFGPVVTVTPFDTEDEAVALANGTRYGLASMVWTSDLSRAHRVASRIEAGVVWVNCWMVRDLRTPFGGVKQSGVGREGGNEALRFFTEPTNLCVRVGDEGR